MITFTYQEGMLINGISITISLNNHSPFVTEDLKQILNYNGSDKSIPKKIKWITIDPGRQFIGILC